MIRSSATHSLPVPAGISEAGQSGSRSDMVDIKEYARFGAKCSHRPPPFIVDCGRHARRARGWYSALRSLPTARELVPVRAKFVSTTQQFTTLLPNDVLARVERMRL